MKKIYTRKFGSPSVPPGYGGSAFGDYGKKRDSREVSGVASDDTGKCGASMTLQEPSVLPESAVNPNEPLTQLLAILRGRLGAEEGILILVILLIASDGLGPEALILSLALAVG